MKYYGVKKVEGTSRENNSFVVEKKEKKAKKGSFLDVFLVQMCVCLMIICVLSVTKLLINPTESVFFQKNTLELANVESVKEIKSNGSEVEISCDDGEFLSVIAGNIEKVNESEIIVKVNDKLSVKYVGLKETECKQGDAIVCGQKIGNLQDDSIKLSLIYGGNKVGNIKVNGNKLEW